MQNTLIILGSLLLITLLFWKKIRSCFSKKVAPLLDIGPSREWQVKCLIGELYQKRDTYFTNEMIVKLNEFEVSAEKKLAEIKSIVSKGLLDIDSTKKVIKNESAAFFDIFGTYEMERDARLDLQVTIAKFDLNIGEKMASIEFGLKRLSLIYEAIRCIKPEVKEDPIFIDKVTFAIESDLCFKEKNVNLKENTFDSIGFSFVLDFVRNINVPTITEKFMPRLQAIPTT